MSVPTDPFEVEQWCDELEASCYSLRGKLIVGLIRQTMHGYREATAGERAQIALAVDKLFGRVSQAEKERANETLEEIRLRKSKGDAFVAKARRLKGGALKAV